MVCGDKEQYSKSKVRRKRKQKEIGSDAMKDKSMPC